MSDSLIEAIYPLEHIRFPASFDAPWVGILHGVFSAEECAELIARLESEHLSPAPINSFAGEIMNPNVRNNDRVIFDDVALAERLFQRARMHFPQSLYAQQLVSFNERFRGYRYKPGQKFAPHYDTTYTRSAVEQSHLTILVYLNDDCVGGETQLISYDITVKPRAGSLLFFSHTMYHEGAEVTSGSKYVLHTDAMYRHTKR